MAIINDQVGSIETLSELQMAPNGRRIISGTMKWSLRHEPIAFTASGSAAEKLAVLGIGHDVTFDAYTATESGTLPDGSYFSVMHCMIDAVKPRTNGVLI